MEYKQFKLSAIPSPEDRRDFISTAIIPRDIPLPAVFSFKDKIKTILMQGQHGICVGCGVADIKNEQEVTDGVLPINGYSPVYIYALCKQIDGIPDIEGTYPRVAMDVLSKKGILPYDEMPISLLDTLGGKLPVVTQDQINRATPQKIASYASIPVTWTPADAIAMKQALVATQSPILIAVQVTNAFYYPEQGKFIGRPNSSTFGGHAVAVIGYDDDLEYTFADGTKCKGFFELQNSWDKTWGNGGFAYFPYDSLCWQLPAPKGYTGLGFVTEMWSCIDDHNDGPQLKPMYWRMQCGAFSAKAKAQNRQAELRVLGLATYLVFIGGLWKIQLGAFLSEEKCRVESTRIKGLGVDNFVTHY